MNAEAVHASPRKTGVVILGGGLPKHHINNANMMRNGADFAVYVNTAQEYDGSDSGAQPDEAVSWGKIRGDAVPVKVSLATSSHVTHARVRHVIVDLTFFGATFSYTAMQR
jgi:deoxyhypusine synthase